MELNLAPISPKNLLMSACDRMKLQAERAGLTLRVECSDDLPNVRADQARLEQVLVNLIHNAVKFTRPGGEVILLAEATKLAAVSDSESRIRESESHQMMSRASLNASIEWIGRAREAAPDWDYPSRVTSLKRTEEKFGWTVSKDREVHFSLRFPKA